MPAAASAILLVIALLCWYHVHRGGSANARVDKSLCTYVLLHFCFNA
jgi:hypothetical protein